MLQRSGASDLEFTWSPIAGASEYRVWSSDTPLMDSLSLVGSTTAASLVEQDGAGGEPGAVVYYEVRAVNVCQWEGP